MSKTLVTLRRCWIFSFGALAFCGLMCGQQRAHAVDDAPPEIVTVALPSRASTLLRRYSMKRQGALQSVSRARLEQPTWSVDPSGHYAYATRRNAARDGYEILQYRIAPDGTTQPLSPAGVAFGGKPPANQWIGEISTELSPIVFEPKRSSLYVLSQEGIWQFHRNADGTLRVLATSPAKTGEARNRPSTRRETPPPGQKDRSYRVEIGNYLEPQSLAFDASRRFAYAISREYYNQDDTTISNWGARGSTRSVEVACWLTKFTLAKDGTLQSPQKPLRLPQGFYQLAVSPAAPIACIANRKAQRVTLYRLPRDGSDVLSPLATLVGQAAAFDSSGRFLYVANDHTFDQYAVTPRGCCTPLTPQNLPLLAGFNVRSRVRSAFMNGQAYPIRVERIELSPGGRRLYFTISTIEGGFLCAYRVNRDGTLAAIPDAAVPIGYSNGATLTVSRGAPAPFVRPAPPAAQLQPISSEFVYVLNYSDATVSQYAITSSGLLAPLSPPTVALKGIWLADMVAHPNGRYLYVAQGLGGRIWQFSISADGTLKPLDPPVVEYGTNPQRLLVEKTGRFLYAVDGNTAEISVWKIGADGTLTRDADKTVFAGYGIGTASLSPANVLHVFSSNTTANAYTIQPDGALKLLSKKQMGQTGRYTYDATGRYAYNAFEDDAVAQFSVQPDGSLVAGEPRAVINEERPTEVTVDPAGRYAYIANKGAFAGDGSITRFAIGADGMLTPTGDTPAFTGTAPFRSVIDASGQFLYALSPGVNRNLQERGQPGVVTSLILTPQGMQTLPQQVQTGIFPVTIIAVRRTP